MSRVPLPLPSLLSLRTSRRRRVRAGAGGFALGLLLSLAAGIRATPPSSPGALLGQGATSGAEIATQGPGAPPPALPPGGLPLLDSEGLKGELDGLLETQLRLPAGDRHALADRLCNCRPSVKGANLVIAMEGTGAYEPRLAPLMETARKRLGARMTPALHADLYAQADKLLETELRRETHWSGLLRGPYGMLSASPDLLGGAFDWFSFPSEEAEMLAGLDALNLDSLRRLPGDIERSVQSEPKGVTRAQRCVRRYLGSAMLSGWKPRIVILSHSSGGRSAVKLVHALEKIRVPGGRGELITVDLVFSIDPVVEAHEAIKEVLPGLLGKGARGALGLAGRLLPEPDVAVRSRSRPGQLYRPTAALRWASVFQKQDTLGLKVSPRFGIHGSPVARAHVDKEIKDLGDDGHGAICYHDETLELLRTELRRLFPAAAAAD